MSAAVTLTDVRELTIEIQAAMDSVQRENRIPESIERYLELRDALVDVNAAAFQALVVPEVFEPYEPEYAQAQQVARVDLPEAMERARRILAKEGT